MTNRATIDSTHTLIHKKMENIKSVKLSSVACLYYQITVDIRGAARALSSRPARESVPSRTAAANLN